MTIAVLIENGYWQLIRTLFTNNCLLLLQLARDVAFSVSGSQVLMSAIKPQMLEVSPQAHR